MKINYQVKIQCTCEILWQQLSIKELHGHWVEQAFPNAQMKGDWPVVGQEVSFIDPLGNETVVIIDGIELGKGISLRHVAILADNERFETGPEATTWTMTKEHYEISDLGQEVIFNVHVECDMAYRDLFNQMIPRAMQALKKDCEEVSENLKFPIGRPKIKNTLNPKERKFLIDQIESLPSELSELLKGASKQSLGLNYRPKGWSIAQVVHHLADSHMNSFIRFKLALTENIPRIKPYQEDLWAELADSSSTEVEDSLVLLTALHKKWTVLLNSLNENQWKQAMKHPEKADLVTLDQALQLYAWHGNHHLSHVNQALSYKFD
ncbi:MAG: YfiT family bacillithiol transferase [Flavobacteriaceae bacterium]